MLDSPSVLAKFEIPGQDQGADEVLIPRSGQVLRGKRTMPTLLKRTM